MGFRAGSFLEGINSGISIGERIQGAKEKADQRRGLRDVANATPEESTGYTATDGEQLQGLASAKDQSGKPYYNVTADESGNYAVAPNQDAQGFGLADYKGSTDPVKIEQGKVTDFLGDRTAGSLSDAQIRSKKQIGMADIVSRSDPERGAKMRRDAVRSEREDVISQREDTEWARKETAAAQEQSFNDQYRSAYGTTIYAQRMSEYMPQAEVYKKQVEERKAALASGTPPETLGPAPVEPVRPAYSVTESLADHGALLDLRMRAGKADPQEVASYAKALQTMHAEGYAKALYLAQSGASIDSIATAFNQSGDMKFDPSSVVSDNMVKNQDGVNTRVIKIKDQKSGEIQTINTLSELDSLGKAGTYYDRFVKIANATKGDKAPSGYRFTPDGGLQAIPGGPGDKRDGDKAPSGYRYKPDGSLEAIPGGPGDKAQTLKALPTSAAGGLISNFQNLRRAEDALALLSGQKLEGGAVGDPQATGLKNMLPNQVLNRIDPKGVDTRAAVADLGSLVIHDRSGAAVTASEFPRLAPFIPTATDDPATARKKLAQFVQNYKATVEDTAEFYRASGYNVPTDTLRTSNSLSSATTKSKTGGIPRISSPADAAKLPSGTEFFDPNGVKRKVP